MRRCVICGREEPYDEYGYPQYHYPKNRQEAQVWKESLNAENITVDALKNYGCVCYTHIPEFVGCTNAVKAPSSTFFRPVVEADCPVKPKPEPLSKVPSHCKAKSPVNVLLMTGASLPTYCGKSCTEEPPGPYNKLSDTDICVLESSFSDMGITFPDDQPEVSVMHCNRKQREAEERKAKSEYDDFSDDLYLYNLDEEEEVCHCGSCTDVLVLARAKDPVCPCGKSNLEEPEELVCCPPGCSPKQVRRSDVPPCGCECDQLAREELGSVIRRQAIRIKELEMILNRQAEINEQIYSKVDELHKEVQNKPQPSDVFHPIHSTKAYDEEKKVLEHKRKDKAKTEKVDRRTQSLLFDNLVKPTTNKDKLKEQKEAEDAYNKNTRGSKGSIGLSSSRRDSKVSIREEENKDENKPAKPKLRKKREKIPFCHKVKYLLKRKPKD